MKAVEISNLAETYIALDKDN